MLVLIAILFTVLMVIGVPVAFALAAAAIPVFTLTNTMPPTILVQKMVAATQNFPLLAVPFFILAGNLMNETGITTRLIAFSRLLAGWMTGGLAQVSVVLSLLMGGISGSAVADASMESRVIGPSMIAQGYSREITSVILAFSSIITATVPPAIGLILFGFINEVSIGRLFLGGVVPGVLLTAILMVTCWIVAKRRGYRPDTDRLPTLGELGRGFIDSIWSLMFPVILIVGFRFGFFTATEAGVFLVFYAMVIGFFIYRELDWRRVYAAFHASVGDLGMIMMLIMMAAVLGYAMTIERVPQQITEFVTTITTDPLGIMLLVVALLVVTGMFLEGAANILLITPIVMPVLVTAGFDPIHLGIIMVSLINFGGLTPPVGVIMFTVCGILNVKTAAYAYASIPFLIALAIFFALLIAFPGLSVWLPNALM